MSRKSHILQTLDDADRPLPTNQVASTVGHHWKAVSNDLHELLEDGEITKNELSIGSRCGGTARYHSNPRNRLKVILLRTEALDPWKEKHPELYSQHHDAIEELFELFIVDLSREMVAAHEEWIEAHVCVKPEHLDTEIAREIAEELREKGIEE